MRYKLLGRSGLRVSEVCLGTMTFGLERVGANDVESRKVYDAFRSAGGNFLDTANNYANGVSEKLVGEFLTGHRTEVVLATKYTLASPGTDPNAAGNHRKSMVQACEASLKRLNTDYLDLYWLHVWDQMTPVEEVMRAMDDLVRQGKVLYAGVCNMPAWVAAKANTLADLRGWTPFVGLQIEYSLIERTSERELLPMAAGMGMGVTAWSPLAGGLLTGKYAGGGDGGGRYDNPSLRQQHIAPGGRTDEVVKAVITVAGECGRSPAQVALAWLRQRPHPVIPIVGATKEAQFQDNLACLTLTLDPSHLRLLDEASRIELGFPHDNYTKELVRTVTYGGMRDQIDA